MISCDVLILGAGPAGAEAAYRLSEAGLRVVVLEKKSLAREKACGGAIQTGELLEFGAPDEDIIERRITNARIFGPSASALEISTEHEGQAGIIVKRSTYDVWLQQRAQRARFIENYQITTFNRLGNKWIIKASFVGSEKLGKSVPQADITIESSFVVHAAGANAGFVEKKLGLSAFPPNGMGITFQRWLDVGEETLDRKFANSIEFHFIPERVPNGYFWMFPKKDVLLAGVGTTLEFARNMDTSLKQELDNFLKLQLPRLGIVQECPCIRCDGGKVPMQMRSSLYGNGFLVVGDAAGVVSMIHGGGIYQARKTSVFAAEAICQYLNGHSDALELYQQRIYEYFTERERRWDKRLKPFLTDKNLVSLILERGRNDESVKRGLGILLSSTDGHRHAYELIEGASFALISEELDEIISAERELVNSELQKLFTDSSDLHKMINQVLLCGGKRLRAILVILVGQALEAGLDELLPVALAYEMSHTASLVHDDIIDGGEWRRGAETLHRKYGLGHAITAGDALLIKGFEMLAAYQTRKEVSKLTLIKLITLGCRSGLDASKGEVLDINFTSNEIRDKSLDDYLELIRLKTGALIEAATEAGAVIAACSKEQTTAMREFGRYLGIAFQIYDDAKDLLAASTVSLKSRFTDIKQGKLTAQLIHTINAASHEDRERLLHLLSLGTLDGAEEILELYRRYDALQFNQKLSRKYLNKAQRKLDALDDSSYKEKLEGIVRVLGYWTRFASD